MYTKLAAATLLASISCAVAAPATEVKPQKHFRLDQVERGRTFKSGAISTLRTYQKFGKTPPESVVKAAAAAQQGIVTASPEQYDSEYLCPVTLGTGSSNPLYLDFDSGSSDLWAFSTLQPASQQSGHKVYNPNASGTKLSGETWDISYEDGSGAKGVVYGDSVVVGGVTATAQAVEAATSASSTFVEDTQSDGLLGLAFQDINTCTPSECRTFFNSVEPTLTSPLFTAALKHNAPGSYTFGFIDSSLYSGSITYVPVDNSEGFWGFTAGGYSVGSASPGSTSIGKSIADTGTTLLYIPSSAASAYYKQVSGSSNSATYGGYVFPCSASLPNFNVKIGSATFTVPGSYINYAPANNAGTVCFGGIQSNTGIGMSIFGDIFLKSVYVVFEPNTPQIGFANPA